MEDLEKQFSKNEANVMAIRDRIQDAVALWNSNRKDSAFLLVLIAVANISAIRYPRSTRKKNPEIDSNRLDRSAFTKTMQSFTGPKLSVQYYDAEKETMEILPIEDIFYLYIRCNLVHEGSMPTNIVFMEEADPGCFSVRAGGLPDRVLKIGEGWFYHLVNSIIQSEEYQVAK